MGCCSSSNDHSSYLHPHIPPASLHPLLVPTNFYVPTGHHTLPNTETKRYSQQNLCLHACHHRRRHWHLPLCKPATLQPIQHLNHRLRSNRHGKILLRILLHRIRLHHHSPDGTHWIPARYLLHLLRTKINNRGELTTHSSSQIAYKQHYACYPC